MINLAKKPKNLFPAGRPGSTVVCVNCLLGDRDARRGGSPLNPAGGRSRCASTFGRGTTYGGGRLRILAER